MTIDTAVPLTKTTQPKAISHATTPGIVGPAAHLEALPQLDAGLPSTLAGVDDHLARVERARQAQLDALPPVPTNVVAAAHRRIVERILDQVDVARARVREGTYGLCAHCNATIHQRVLEREPWQTACPACDTSAR